MTGNGYNTQGSRDERARKEDKAIERIQEPAMSLFDIFTGFEENMPGAYAPQPGNVLKEPEHEVSGRTIKGAERHYDWIKHDPRKVK